MVNSQFFSLNPGEEKIVGLNETLGESGDRYFSRSASHVDSKRGSDSCPTIFLSRLQRSSLTLMALGYELDKDHRL